MSSTKGASHWAEGPLGESGIDVRGTRPGAWTGRRLALFSLALASVLVAIAVASYYRYVRFERVLIEHVPANAEWAALLEIEKVPVFEPLRRHVIPVLSTLGRVVQEPGNFARLRERDGINLLRDTREVLVVSAGGGTWGVGVAGQFAKRGLIARAFQSLQLAEQGWVLESHDGPARMATYASGAVGAIQAADGALFIASPASFARELAEPRSLPADWLDCSTGEGCAGISREASWLRPGLDALGLPPSSGDLHASLSTAEDFLVTLRYPSATADWENRSSARSLIDRMARGLPSRDWGGERAVVSRLDWRREGQLLILNSRWTRSEADRAARSFAAWLERNVREGLVRPAEQR